MREKQTSEEEEIVRQTVRSHSNVLGRWTWETVFRGESSRSEAVKMSECHETVSGFSVIARGRIMCMSRLAQGKRHNHDKCRQHTVS